MKKAIGLFVAILGLIMSAPACASKVTPAVPQAKVSSIPGTTPAQTRQTAPIPTDQERSLAKLIMAAQQEKKLNLYSFELGAWVTSIFDIFKQKALTTG